MVKQSEVDSTSDIKWEDPPPGRFRYDWTAIAQKLRERPGEWALIFERDRASLVTAIRINGIAAVAPAQGFECRTSNNTRDSVRTCTLHMRYNPERVGN